MENPLIGLVKLAKGENKRGKYSLFRFWLTK